MNLNLDNAELAPKMIAIFVFVLILSGNYLGELFPCRVQQIFSENMYAKHALGYLTLVFFVTLTIPELKQSDTLLFLTTAIYAGFIITSKTYYTFWFLIFGLVGAIYLLDLKNKSIDEISKNNEDDKDNEEKDKIKLLISQVQKYLSVSVGISTLIGFITYLGYKKLEYKDKFNYMLFLFGKPACRGISPPFPGYLKTIKYAFTH